MTGADLYFALQRMINFSRTRLLRNSFYAFGARSTLVGPLRLVNAGTIDVGSDVYVGSGCWLQGSDSKRRIPTLRIGNGVSITGDAILSALSNVLIEDDVLLARGVFICDHTHRMDGTEPILRQGSTEPKPVHIGRGCWLGQNVVIMPGVSLGEGTVVGANSIVSSDLPSHVVAVGSPARVVREI